MTRSQCLALVVALGAVAASVDGATNPAIFLLLTAALVAAFGKSW